MRFRTLLLLLTVVLVFAFAGHAFALTPKTSPSSVIATESFESTPLPSYVSLFPYYPIFTSTGWWGPIGFIHHSGSKSLWCVGSTVPTSWPGSYETTSGGKAVFALPQLADYYSSSLGFYYSMPSLGDDDGDGFIVAWMDHDNTFISARRYGLATFPLTAEGAWRAAAWTMAPSSGGHDVSRRPVDIVFQWYDKQESLNQTNYTGEGPSIDDVSVTGYMYGPVRSLTGTRTAVSAVLTWAPPYAATNSTVVDTRTITYHVFRSPDLITPVWTEVGSTTSTSWADGSPLDTRSKYFVQAFSASATTWGDPSGSNVIVTIPDFTKPVTHIAGVPAGWTKSSVSFTLAASDEPTNTLTSHYRYNTSVWQTYPGHAVTLGVEGQTAISYYSVDQDGNAETPKSVTAKIDKTAPVTDISIAPDAGSTAVILDPADTYSGVASTHYTVDGGVPQSGTAFVLTGLGDHIVTWYSADNAGNVEATHSQLVNVSKVGVDPIAGANRYATAVEAVEKAFPAGSSTVVIASGRNFPDALGASALCGAYGSPLLLTEKTYIPDVVKAEITKLGANHAVIIGSDSAVSSAVTTQLAGLVGGFSHVARIGGLDRYDTAAQVATKTASLGTGTSDDVFLAVGDNFPDALAASPAAYSKRWPILLSRRTYVPKQTLAAIASLKPKRIHVLGSTATIPDSVVGQIPGAIAFDRWAGTTRYATAVDVANKSGLSYDGVAIATGQNFPDALAGGVMAGKMGSVVLLTPTDYLASETRGALVAHKADISVVRYLGTIDAVSDAVRTAVSALFD